MIRPFEPEDWPVFIQLMHALHEEGGVRSLRFSERDMLDSIKKPDLYHVLATREDGEVVGCCMGWVEKTFFGPDLIANQHLFYVVPYARGGHYAREMMKAFEEWAIDNDAHEIWVSQATGIKVEQTRKFFEHLGFVTMGSIAKKSV